MAYYGEEQMREFFERAQIIVVGGGAAGMMAATVAARNGADVLLFEKNDRLTQGSLPVQEIKAAYNR